MIVNNVNVRNVNVVSVKMIYFQHLFSKFKSKVYNLFAKGFKYGKWVGIIWVASLLIISPIIFVLFGWQVLVAYLICKFTGACPF